MKKQLFSHLKRRKNNIKQKQKTGVGKLIKIVRFNREEVKEILEDVAEIKADKMKFEILNGHVVVVELEQEV